MPHRLIGAVGQQHVIAGPQVTQQRHADGRQSGREQAGAVGTLQFADCVLQREGGGRAAGAVAEDAFLAPPLAHFALVSGIFEDDRAGTHDRRVDGRATDVRRGLSSVGQAGLRTPFPGQRVFVFHRETIWTDGVDRDRIGKKIVRMMLLPAGYGSHAWRGLVGGGWQAEGRQFPLVEQGYQTGFPARYWRAASLLPSCRSCTKNR